jgi:hypothetical protein
MALIVEDFRIGSTDIAVSLPTCDLSVTNPQGRVSAVSKDMASVRDRLGERDDAVLNEAWNEMKDDADKQIMPVNVEIVCTDKPTSDKETEVKV